MRRETEFVRPELAFERDFLASWPAGSPAHASYFRRITEGPGYGVADAVRLAA